MTVCPTVRGMKLFAAFVVLLEWSAPVHADTEYLRCTYRAAGFDMYATIDLDHKLAKLSGEPRDDLG
jgi:hypothetical protein